MDRNRVPIMADSLLSSIATFHTMKIIVTDPTKFSYIGSIPEAMLGCISASSNLLQQYRKRPSVGPRDLTPTMLRSIEEADKPARGARSLNRRRRDRSQNQPRSRTPKKRKTDKVAPSQPQPKKQKKPARRLILQSSSDSDLEYVPPKQKNALPSDSENESFDEEASDRGDTPPRSPTPEIPVRSLPPSPPPVTIPVSIPLISPITTSQPFTTIPIPTPIFTDTTSTTTTKPTFTVPNPPIDSTYFSPYRVQSEDDDDEPITKRRLQAVHDKLDQLLSSSSSGAPLEAALKALFSLVVAKHSATLSAAAKAIEASSSQCQHASIVVDASTKECKEATAKFDKLVSEAHLFLDSLQAAATKNAATVNTSVETLQKTLQSECSNLVAARHAIEEANASLHAKVSERLTQLEADLAMENWIMDELDKRTTQLKLQLHKVRTANAEINDLKSEREVIRSSAADVHSILLHLIEARGEQESKQQPPPSSSKPAVEPKVNEASVSNKSKKKNKIGENDTDNEDDVYVDIPKKPVPKDNTSEKQTEEITKKQRVEIEQKRKEAELLVKKKSMFPVWTKDSL
ncbi:uncharacterized protein LOC128133688 [Lactuca sativa]|uniref:uncharacterized protein LOC128133688 n=1 Tax=Lactuca sativa TaxID=4236 RepID=UPI000CD8B75D|nr:uncharacterized protein LOC128133688 [Lactuca sativa]